MNLENLMRDDRHVQGVMKRLIALAFLPPEDDPRGFDQLRAAIDDQYVDRLHPFMQYFQQQWIQIIGPADFSIFGMAARTSNALKNCRDQWGRILRVRPPHHLFVGKTSFY